MAMYKHLSGNSLCYKKATMPICNKKHIYHARYDRANIFPIIGRAHCVLNCVLNVLFEILCNLCYSLALRTCVVHVLFFL